MMLESREGEAVALPLDRSRRVSIRPMQNCSNSMRPTATATWSPSSGSSASRHRAGAGREVTPSPQEIAAYYKANQATYGSKETRSISQVVVPDQATANGIAARAKGGRRSPRPLRRRVPTRPSRRCRTRPGRLISSVAGDKAAAAVFSAPNGAVVGPLQTDFGWVVVKIDGVRRRAANRLPRHAGDHGQADRRQAEECDRGCRRQDPECGRRGQQFRRGGRGCEASRYEHAANLRRRVLEGRPEL